jgi:NADPH:quinone reductase-like Zn-dependent oxidoreductase
MLEFKPINSQQNRNRNDKMRVIAPVIDRCYNLSEVPAAIRYLEERQVQGKVAINV